MSRTSGAHQPTDMGTVEVVVDNSSHSYVEWTGSAGVREVTVEQWKAAGVEDQDTVLWTRESPRVSMSALTVAAQERLAAEPDFKFVTE